MGRECVEGGVEDRGQVKLKHGAQRKQRPSAFLTSLHTTLKGPGKGQVYAASQNQLFWFFRIRNTLLHTLYSFERSRMDQNHLVVREVVCHIFPIIYFLLEIPNTLLHNVGGNRKRQFMISDALLALGVDSSFYWER